MARFSDASKTASQLLSRFTFRGKGLVEAQDIRNVINSAAAGIDTTATAGELDTLDNVVAAASIALTAGAATDEMDIVIFTLSSQYGPL